MSFFSKSGGLGNIFGSFASKIISGLQSIGGSIADALHLGRSAGASPVLETVEREWAQAAQAKSAEPSFGGLRPFEFVPHEMFTESEMPWDKPFAYKVNLYGRDINTGRFTSQDFDITVSREMTIDEIENETIARIGATGESPAIEIFKARVIGASKRAGEE